MPDADNLAPADPSDLAAALAYALRYPPVFTSQSRAVLSPEAVTTRAPSGEKAAL